MDAARSELIWNLVGRGPAAATLVLLTLHARRVMGTTQALLGLGGFSAGAIVGTSLVPSILGALGGGVLGALATWRATRAPLPGPGPFAVALLAVVALGRVGCLLTGCCFGHPSDGPFAVHYPVGSLAQALHVDLGLVAPGQAPLGVFPVQAVESLGLVVLLAAAFAVRRRVRSEGAWALMLAAGYLGLRAVVDPWRAMVNTVSSAHALGPLSRFQWGAMAAALACVVAAALVARREGRAQGSGAGDSAPRSGVAAWLAWVLPTPWARGASMARGGTAGGSPRPERATASPSPRPKAAGGEGGEVLVPLRLGVTLWAAQALASLACHGEGTFFLRVLAVGALAASAVALAWSVESLRRNVRWGLIAAASALLLPLVPHAADGEAATRVPGWIYAADPNTHQLVRLGPGATPLSELEARYAALLGVPLAALGEGAEAPPAPPLVPAEPTTPVAPAPAYPPLPGSGTGTSPTPAGPPLPGPTSYPAPPPNAPDEVSAPTRPGRFAWSLRAAGGIQAYRFTTCGSTTTGVMHYVQTSAAFEHRRDSGDTYQLRARLLVGTDGTGVGASASGLYEWKFQYAALAAGLELGGQRLADLRPMGVGLASAFSSSGNQMDFLAWPILYVRLKVLEFGTGGRMQPVSGPFVGLRFGEEDASFLWRFGLEATWLPYPLANSNFYLSGRWLFPSMQDAVELRGVFSSGSGTQPAFNAGLLYQHHFD